jgi:O-antigen/teichoic acid export membrane protein
MHNFPEYMQTVVRRLTSRIRQRLVVGSVAHRLARGAGWSLFGSLSSQALSLLSTIVVARLVGRVGYGEIGMVQSTLGAFGILAGFGLGSTTAKYIAEFRSASPGRAGGILALTTLAAFGGGVALALACLALAPSLSASVLGSGTLTPLLQAGSLLLLVTTLNGVQMAALSGFEAFGRIAKINILQGLATPIVAIPCVWAYGVPGAIAALTVTAGIGLILSSIALDAECRAHGIPRDLRSIAWSEWPVLWKFALPSMLSALMVAPVTWITNAILVRQPDGYGELGLFNAANQWRTLILYVPAALGPALIPILSETYGRNDHADFRQAVYLSLHVTWICALPLTILVLGWAEPLAGLFGRQFAGAGQLIPLLAVACFLNVVNSTVGTALAGSGRMWIGMSMNAGWAAVLIGATMLLVPRLGGQGLAIAYLVAYLLHTVWVMVYVDRRLAPSSIAKQWRLIAFSAATLGASFGLGATRRESFAYQLALLIVALVPLYRMAKAGLWKRA